MAQSTFKNSDRHHTFFIFQQECRIKFLLGLCSIAVIFVFGGRILQINADTHYKVLSMSTQERELK